MPTDAHHDGAGAAVAVAVAVATWHSPRSSTVHLQPTCRLARNTHTLDRHDWSSLTDLVERLVNADDPDAPHDSLDALTACALCARVELALRLAGQPAASAVRPPVGVGLLTPAMTSRLATRAQAGVARHQLERFTAAAGWPAPLTTGADAAVDEGTVEQQCSYSTVDPAAVALLASKHLWPFWLPGPGTIEVFGTFLGLELTVVAEHDRRRGRRGNAPTELEHWATAKAAHGLTAD